MSTTIFYFSATGNCLKVARDLARELQDADIVSIPGVIDRSIVLSSERIGIIYPVYIFGMPLIVARFIKKLAPAKDKYIFAIATYGGKAADTLGQNARLLKSQGQKLCAGFIEQMPGNYTPLYGALPIEKQNKLFAKEAKRIKEIAAIIREKKQAGIEKDAPLLRWLFSGLYRAMSPKIPFLDKDFWADDKCNSCGVCVKVCPVENIELYQGRPVWLHRCEQCFACLHWCPAEAVQYGRKTLGRKRYRHPEARLEDFFSSPS